MSFQYVTLSYHYLLKVFQLLLSPQNFTPKVENIMRYFPNATSLESEGRALNSLNKAIDLKTWQAKATSDDLHTLYKGKITNNTGYRLYDLMFAIYYTNPEARFLRSEMQIRFRELMEGELTVDELRDIAVAKFKKPEPAKAEEESQLFDQ